VVYGTLLDLHGGVLLLDVNGIGPLPIELSLVRRLCPWDRPGHQHFRGPGQLEDWQATGTGWTQSGGESICSGRNGRLSRDLSLPPRGRIEFVLTWHTRLDCEFGIGVADDETAAFRFEVWNDEAVPPDPFDRGGLPLAGDRLMLVRTHHMAADAVVVQTLRDCWIVPANPGSRAGRVHLQAYYDRDAGWMRVDSSSGEPLAELRLPGNPPSPGRGLRIENLAGDLRIERIEVYPWDGERPMRVAFDHFRIARSDGSQIDARHIAFDAQQRTFEIETAAGLRTVPEQERLDLDGSPTTAPTPQAVRARFVNGQCLSGELEAFDSGKIQLRCTGIRETVLIPVNLLQSLTPVVPEGTFTTLERARNSWSDDSPLGDFAPSPLAQPIGTLQLPGASVHGRLIDNADPEHPGLVWKPEHSTTASRLRPQAVAVIDFAEPGRQLVQKIRAHNRAVRRHTSKGNAPGTPPAALLSFPAILHLRSGDKIGCHIVSISADQVTFESPNSNRASLPDRYVAALDLRPDLAPGATLSPKFASLLTLPRSQRANPPTHLVHALDGDGLRGRVVNLTSQELQIDLRQQRQSLPRDVITRILWLHPEGARGSPPPDPNQAGPNQAGPNQAGHAFVQALLDNQLRVSFDVDQVVGDLLLGRSDPLGNGRVDLAQTIRLDINPPRPPSAIEESPEWTAWTMRPAIAPKSEQDPSAARTNDAVASVGTLAADF
jgi:hypothetical protein